MDLNKELSKKINDLIGVEMGKSSDSSDFLKSMNTITGSLEQKEERDIKKNKKQLTMDKPIGKLFSIGKSETKEATGSGAAGGFVTALSGEMKEKEETNEKWSQKYKDSIDCSNPKGFSQRAHCAGKKKKQEFKEATSSASAGAYDAPGFEDVKMKGNHPKGSGSSFKNTQIPGGGFVKVKEKCKTFPYCNQGDINALTITKPKKKKKKKTISEMIDEVSKKYNVSPEYLKKLIIKDYNKNKL